MNFFHAKVHDTEPQQSLQGDSVRDVAGKPGEIEYTTGGVELNRVIGRILEDGWIKHFGQTFNPKF